MEQIEEKWHNFGLFQLVTSPEHLIQGDDERLQPKAAGHLSRAGFSYRSATLREGIQAVDITKRPAIHGEEPRGGRRRPPSHTVSQTV